MEIAGLVAAILFGIWGVGWNLFTFFINKKAKKKANEIIEKTPESEEKPVLASTKDVGDWCFQHEREKLRKAFLEKGFEWFLTILLIGAIIGLLIELIKDASNRSYDIALLFGFSAIFSFLVKMFNRYIVSPKWFVERKRKFLKELANNVTVSDFESLNFFTKGEFLNYLDSNDVVEQLKFMLSSENIKIEDNSIALQYYLNNGCVFWLALYFKNSIPPLLGYFSSQSVGSSSFFTFNFILNIVKRHLKENFY